MFEDRDGRRGSFLLVLDSAGNVEFVTKTDDNRPGFGVIKATDTGLVHLYCLECDVYFELEAVGADRYDVKWPSD